MALLLCRVPFMLSVTIKPFSLNATQKVFHNIGSWLENVFSPDFFVVQTSSKQRKEKGKSEDSIAKKKENGI
jgi:hypothetical protein